MSMMTQRVRGPVVPTEPRPLAAARPSAHRPSIFRNTAEKAVGVHAAPMQADEGGKPACTVQGLWCATVCTRLLLCPSLSLSPAGWAQQGALPRIILLDL